MRSWTTTTLIHVTSGIVKKVGHSPLLRKSRLSSVPTIPPIITQINIKRGRYWSIFQSILKHTGMARPGVQSKNGMVLLLVPKHEIAHAPSPSQSPYYLCDVGVIPCPLEKVTPFDVSVSSSDLISLLKPSGSTKCRLGDSVDSFQPSFRFIFSLFCWDHLWHCGSAK